MKHCGTIAFLLALCVCASGVLLACSSDEGGTADSDTESFAADTVRPGLPVGDDTEVETAPPAVLPPETTEAHETEAPVQNPPSEGPDTVEPSENVGVDKPNRDPVNDHADGVTDGDDSQGALHALAGKIDSGRFVSEQSPNLVLCIDWESVIGEDGTADVAVTVGISHYRLFSRAKPQMGVIQIDGNAILFDTPAIEYDENTKSYTFFGSYWFETDRSEVEVEASWRVLGEYGGVEIDTLTAGGTIVLAQDSDF